MNLDANGSPMLKALKRRIAEMGPHFDQVILRETATLYQPLQPTGSEKVRVQHDVFLMRPTSDSASISSRRLMRPDCRSW